MADDIVERLRKAPLYTSWGEACDLPEAAADLIERQNTRIAELEADVAALKNPWRPMDEEARNGDPYWLSDGFSVRLGFWGGDARLWVDLVKAENLVFPEGLRFTPTLYMPFPTPSPNRED